MTSTRIERDSMGEMAIPQAAYYGIQTMRAAANFVISGLKPLPIYIDACMLIKKSTALVNAELGCISHELGMAIALACDEILENNFRDQFIVDIYQAGAGTSHHMNVNEVLANRALEILGEAKGNYGRVSPNDHVNYGQSTNDVIPTAIRVGALIALERYLFPALSSLGAELRIKAQEFESVIKSGRTHLQDAVPVRLGDEFLSYAQIISDHGRRLRLASGELQILGIGGSAAGTGLNTHPAYRDRVCERLQQYTGFNFQPTNNLMAAMQSMAAFVQVSGALRNLAQDVNKIANDLRLMDSGPKTGLREIQLPAVQPGSSIMPGKYNPVIAEMTNMVCFQVIGLDTAICLAAQAGQLELNVMMPLIAYDLLHSIEILGNAIDALARKCIAGIVANRDRCLDYAEGSLSLVTALNPYIGYLNSAEVARQSLASGKSIRQIVLEQGLMSADQLTEVLDLAEMSRGVGV
ncbi:MAG: aspartate ammonia-lyase [Pseudanabaenaceae cyanobacterium bins.68]|nr:aspartate ammonia-lyase [Pseudanabaenaceae cyanobacterium bins.68]